MNRNEIFTLWVEGPLDEFTKLCLKSWLRLGFTIKLFMYDEPSAIDISEFPQVQFLDASDIIEFNEKLESYAEQADWFRFNYLYKFGGTWIDSDEFLIRKPPDNNIIISSEACKKTGAYAVKDRDFTPNIGVLRFPKNHKILEETIKKCDNAIKKDLKSNSNRNSLMKIFQKIVLKKCRKFVAHPLEYCPIAWAYVKDIYTQPNVKSTNKFMIIQPEMEFIIQNSVGIHLWRNLALTKGYFDKRTDNCIFNKLLGLVS